MQRFYSSAGLPIPLADRIGVGGEGAVFAHGADKSLVCKVYHKQLVAPLDAKLRAMISLGSPQLRAVSAWPVDTLHRSPGSPIAGFVMPRMSGFEPIHKLYSPHDRKRSFASADWRFLIAAARNACAIVDEVHASGCVVGDINENGILVDQKAIVRLIDCDSFQVRANGTTFVCRVGVPPFTPPELIGKDLDQVVRTPNHDAFGLAVHVFHLLMMGRHPYAGRYSGSGEMPIEKAIATFSYAYGRGASAKRMAPPPNSLPIAALPPAIAALFEKAFTEEGVTARPAASEWVKVLGELNTSLRKCGKTDVHYFYNGLTSCPWCRIEDEAGVLFFLPLVKDLAGRLGLDIANLGQSFDEKLRRIRRATKPPLPAFVDPADIACAGKPVDQELLVGGLSTAHRIVARLIGAFVLVSLWASMPAAFLVWIILAIILFFLTGESGAKAKLRAEIARRVQAANNAEANWQRLRSQAPLYMGLKAIDDVLAQVNTLEQQYRGLPAWKDAQRRQLESSVRERQLEDHLDNFEIRRFKISGFGAARVAMLRSYNIETARDITRANLGNVPGIGSELASRLYKWRKDQENKFVFDPKKGLSPSDLMQLEVKYKQAVHELNVRLGKAAENLVSAVQNSYGRAAELKRIAAKAAQDVAQTRADVQVAQAALATMS